ELLDIQKAVRQVLVDDTIKRYIVEMANWTRKSSYVYLGASPRASIALMKASQALAFIRGRDYVLPDDVQYLVPYVFSHRIILKPEAKFEGVTTDEIIQQGIHRIPVPIQRFVK